MKQILAAKIPDKIPSFSLKETEKASHNLIREKPQALPHNNNSNSESLISREQAAKHGHHLANLPIVADNQSNFQSNSFIQPQKFTDFPNHKNQESNFDNDNISIDSLYPWSVQPKPQNSQKSRFSTILEPNSFQIQNLAQLKASPFKSDVSVELHTQYEKARHSSFNLANIDIFPKNSASSLIQCSPVSVAVKQGAKIAAKKAIKEFIENRIKARLKNYLSKNFAKQFLEDADAILDILDSSWWEIGIELIPIAGDLYGASSFAKKIDKIWDKVKLLEKQVQLVTTAASKAMKRIDLSAKLTGKGKEKLEQVVNKINRISEHLTEDDLAGAAKDILGKPVIINGKKYDHLQEVRQATKGLGNQLELLIEGISKSEFEGDVLEEANRLLSQLSKHKDQIQNVLLKVSEAK